MNETAEKAENVIYAADLFCGAGGATQALMDAAAELGARVEMVAVNHWDTAIKTHEANFPGVVHHLHEVGKVDPVAAVPGGYLDILLAGPECTHFSRARGGRPKNKQSRANATDIIWWLESLYVRNVLIENVPEIETWGPLDDDGRVCKKWEGYYFRIFIDTLRELGYSVQWRKCVAANYGDPTTRERLFIMATRGGDPVWPAVTHRPAKDVARFPGAKPWVPAREIIDWSIKGESIYARKKPLADNTMRRIFAGIKKFSGLPFLIPNFGEREGQEPRTHGLSAPAPAVTGHGAGCLVEPCLVVLRGTDDRQIGASAKPTSATAPTLCAEAGHLAVSEPVVRPVRPVPPYLFANRNNNTPQDPAGDAVPTLCTGNHIALCAPSVAPFLYYGYTYGNGKPHPGRKPAEPMPTVTATWDHIGVVEPRIEPLIVGAGGPQGQGDARSADAGPLGSVMTENHRALVEAFVLANRGGDDAYTRAREAGEPLQTVTTDPPFQLVQPFLASIVYTGGNGGYVYGGDRPAPTLTTQAENAVVEPVIEPLLVRYNGGKDGDARHQSAGAPLTTLDTSNRFALCQFIVKYYGSGDCTATLADPLATVTAHDRFALVELVLAQGGPQPLYHGYVIGWLDILFRMLQVHELAAAHSFPRSYVFFGTKTEQTAQIGNSWPVLTGKALILSALTREGGAPRPLPAHVAAVAGSVHRRRVPKSRSLWAGARRRMEEPAERLAPTLFTDPAGAITA